MVRIKDCKDLTKVDFSFVPSLACNLSCSFCMYSCGPDVNKRLSLDVAKQFLTTVDWEQCFSWGFYGGEVSYELPFYQLFIDLLPKSVSRFVITNGSWSTDVEKTSEFLHFAYRNRLFVVISGTEEHKKYQNRAVIESFKDYQGIKLKEGDDIHPMGRARRLNWSCTQKCLHHPQPIRMAMFPGGVVVLQNCDGVYPVVGYAADGWEYLFNKAVEIRNLTCVDGVRNINDVLMGEEGGNHS